MKPLSKLHQDAIVKAKTEQDKVKAAAVAMIETPMEMIRAILLKHEQAVIEVMRDLEREKERAVRAEINKVAVWMIDHGYATGHGDTIESMLDELDWQAAERFRK